MAVGSITLDSILADQRVGGYLTETLALLPSEIGNCYPASQGWLLRERKDDVEHFSQSETRRATVRAEGRKIRHNRRLRQVSGQ